MPAAEVSGPPAADAATHVDIETSTPISPPPTHAVPASAQQPWSVPLALQTYNLPRPTKPPTNPITFLHFLERLKTTPREGWRRFRIAHGESIADHMYRMAVITMLAPPAIKATVDVGRCTQLALVHDMAESLVGDITPMDGVDKKEKNRREKETMEFLAGGLLGAKIEGMTVGEANGVNGICDDTKGGDAHINTNGADGNTNGGANGITNDNTNSHDTNNHTTGAKSDTPGITTPSWMADRGADLLSAWEEYEAGATKEAAFVKDVDKIELLLQMREYEVRADGEIDLGEFVHVAGGVKLPEMREWTVQILVEREDFWKKRDNKTKDGTEVEGLDWTKELGY